VPLAASESKFCEYVPSLIKICAELKPADRIKTKVKTIETFLKNRTAKSDIKNYNLRRTADKIALFIVFDCNYFANIFDGLIHSHSPAKLRPAKIQSIPIEIFRARLRTWHFQNRLAEF